MSKLILYIKIIINFIFVIGAVLLLFLFLPRLLEFFLPFVIGWVVAMIANPLVRFLEKRVKILRKHSSVIIIVVVIAAVLGSIYMLIFFLVKEIVSLVNDIPDIMKQVGDQLTNVSEQIKELSISLPAGVQDFIDNFSVEVSNYVTEIVDGIEPPSMDLISNLAKNIAEIFLMTIITILSAYFFTVHRDELIAGLKKHLPASINEGWHLIYDNFKKAFGGYFKAQFKIMLVLTVIMFIAFEVLGVAYSFLLAFGIALLDVLPVFGTGAVLWPWAVLEMIGGNYFRAIGLIVVYLICQILKQVLQPKMVGDSIGISPLTTLVFMFIGYRFYSVLGMILGIPIGMVCVNLYRIGAFERIIRGFKIIVHDINEFRKF